jgi:hypothetical protein
VWIFKGEILEHDPMAQDKKMAEGEAGVRAAMRPDRPALGLKGEMPCCNRCARNSAAHKGHITPCDLAPIVV